MGRPRVAERKPALRASALPRYLATAIANYLKLLDYLRELRPALGEAAIPVLDAATPDALVAAYLRSRTTQPMLLVLEADIRRIYADPAFKAASSGKAPPVAVPRLQRWLVKLGLARSAERRPVPAKRPPLKSLLVGGTTDAKATALTQSLARLVKARAADPAVPAAAIAAFVRTARFAEANPTRDRKLVAALFALGPLAGILLADTLLAGKDLFGLTPFVLLQGTRAAVAIGDDARAVALATLFFAKKRSVALAGEIGELGTAAALRSGRYEEAAGIAARWRAVQPGSPGARIAAAAAAAAQEPDGAVRTLAAAGGELAGGDPAVSVLFAEAAGRARQFNRAERAIRLALAAPAAARADLLAALHNVHVRRGRELGCLDALFAGSGTALRWTRFRPQDLVDTGPGMGPGGDTKVAVILPLLEGGVAFETTCSSILGQSHAALEIVLVVPAGREPPSIADPRIRVVEAEAGNWAAAVNAGIVATDTRLVAWAREGDFWLRDLVARHLEARRGAPAVRATLGRALTASDEGLVALGVGGTHAVATTRAAMVDRRVFGQGGPLEPVDEGAAPELLGRIALTAGAGALREIDRILSVIPADALDAGRPADEAERLRTTPWREARLTAAIAELRTGRTPRPADAAAETAGITETPEPAAVAVVEPSGA